MQPFLKDLRLNSVGGDVFRLQKMLEQLKYDDFVPTGFFGPKTLHAVSEFQFDHDIEDTGFFGPITRAAMNEILGFSNREILFLTAVSCLGIDASPDDEAPDELGCADTVTSIIRKAKFSFPLLVSTAMLYRHLLEGVGGFQEVQTPLRGDIIISPTGYGSGSLTNGHTGIMGDNGLIMSNDSWTGLFKQNYNLETWKARYVDVGGFPMKFFRKM